MIFSEKGSGRMLLSTFMRIFAINKRIVMANFIGGPAGGYLRSRTLGTKVTLAGRTAFLPNDDVPFVMQKLTMG